MVPTFLEENLRFREVIHLRKHQGISQQGRKQMVTLPQVSSAAALCQEDASFSHPPQTPDPAKSSASTPTAKTLSVSRGFPGLCWCLDAPGMENNGERGILAARLKLTWGSYGSCPGITAHRLFQPCTFIP